MKKIINNPDQFVDEMVEGILLAHPDQVRTPGDDRRVLVRADSPAPGRVGIVTGGGSGHLPLFKGYVGKGLCSGVAIGNVFSSPSVQQCADAAKAVDGGAGVLFLYGNYGGDVFNFDLAVDLLELDGIETRTVLGCDDVASQPKERAKDRRGVAGIFFAYKAAGAAAERGDSLDEVAAVAQKVVDNTATMGVGLSPTILPTTGAASFDLPEGEMEIGIGISANPASTAAPSEPPTKSRTRSSTPSSPTWAWAKVTVSPSSSTASAPRPSKSSTCSTAAPTRGSRSSASSSSAATSANTRRPSKWPAPRSRCSRSTTSSSSSSTPPPSPRSSGRHDNAFTRTHPAHSGFDDAAHRILGRTA